MSSQRRMMKLGAFLPAPGHHVAAWRHPEARPDGGLDFDHYRPLVQTAERGLFDMVFLSDAPEYAPSTRTPTSSAGRDGWCTWRR
ncbi:hypothetical protein ABZT06_47985 [Streptomyces sp. NPDC005483]|uniref:hypothetical protein n=1 Tax=Streptomyces sp. NPDC005483 TaxID=3154882 RepID=UPI0033A842F7